MPGQNIRRPFPRHCGISVPVEFRMREVSGSLLQKSRRERWRGERDTATVRTHWQLNSYDRNEERSGGESRVAFAYRAQSDSLFVCGGWFRKGGFPRSLERGPIEAHRHSRSWRFVRNFRVHWNAAPLKPLPLSSRRYEWRGFPRSLERGPIEAGPPRFCTVPSRSFPRSLERGPIEAWDWGRAARSECCYFRVHWNAAPLKPDGSRLFRERAKPFPRSLERGPIEADS